MNTPHSQNICHCDFHCFKAALFLPSSNLGACAFGDLHLHIVLNVPTLLIASYWLFYPGSLFFLTDVAHLMLSPRDQGPRTSPPLVIVSLPFIPGWKKCDLALMITYFFAKCLSKCYIIFISGHFFC